MKPTQTLLLLAATLATAQDITQIPACALGCIETALTKGTKCTTTDFACICANLEAITSAATTCVLDACGLDTALNKVLPATKNLCSSIPAPAPAPVPAPAPPAVSSAAPAPVVTTTSKPAPAPTVSKPAAAPVPTAPATGDEDCDDGAPPATTLVTSAVPVSSSTPPVVVKPSGTTTAKLPVVTAGAAGLAGAGVGSFGVVVLGAVMVGVL